MTVALKVKTLPRPESDKRMQYTCDFDFYDPVQSWRKMSPIMELTLEVQRVLRSG